MRCHLQTVWGATYSCYGTVGAWASFLTPRHWNRSRVFSHTILLLLPSHPVSLSFRGLASPRLASPAAWWSRSRSSTDKAHLEFLVQVSALLHPPVPECRSARTWIDSFFCDQSKVKGLNWGSIWLQPLTVLFHRSNVYPHALSRLQPQLVVESELLIREQTWSRVVMGCQSASGELSPWRSCYQFFLWKLDSLRVWCWLVSTMRVSASCNVKF